MAFLNLAVSFSLALSVALWAKNTTAPKLIVVYKALLKKFFARPLDFFLPQLPLKTKVKQGSKIPK